LYDENAYSTVRDFYQKLDEAERRSVVIRRTGAVAKAD
jgi:hypothetical protein